MTQKNTTLESMRRILGESPIVQELEQELQRRELITKLVAMRAAKGLSQKDIADKMDCSQSRISKLESSNDDDIRIGDLHAYLNAIGLDIHGIIAPLNWTAVSQIKFYAMQIKSCLKKLCDLARDDEQIRDGVQRFHIETLVNMTKVIVDSSQGIPASLSLEMPSVMDVDEDEIENGLAAS